MTETPDLTCVYYTSNTISDYFSDNTERIFNAATEGLPLISVSHRPMDFGDNLVVDLPRSHFNIYRQALIGAKEAKTKYIALCEDDVLYSAEHFKYRPKDKPFAYNFGVWGIYTWQDPPIFNFKGGGRVNLGNLICDRVAFIEAMEERFRKYPNDEVNKELWAEPGKYERQLGVSVQEFEVFYTNPPNIMFSHETALSFAGLGTRKRAGELRATEIPYWNRAEDIRKLYG